MEQELAASLKITAGFVMDVTFIFRIFVTLPRKNRNLSSTNNQRSNYFANAAATAIRASCGTVQVLKTDWQLSASAASTDFIPASFIISSSSALSKFSSNEITHQQGFAIAKHWWSVCLLPTQVSPASGNLESPSFCIHAPLQLRLQVGPRLFVLPISNRTNGTFVCCQTSPEARGRASGTFLIGVSQLLHLGPTLTSPPSWTKTVRGTHFK